MFTRLVGQSPQGLIFPRADQNFIPYTIDEAIDRHLNPTPVIKISVADVDSAKFQYKQSKGTYPTISVEAAQTWRNDAGGIEGSSDETTAMLRMRYNLFNGGSDVANAEKLCISVKQSERFTRARIPKCRRRTSLVLECVRFNSATKEFLADHVDSASETVIAEKQYRIGKRTLLDLLNTEKRTVRSKKELFRR